jgi:hypothetical protein
MLLEPRDGPPKEGKSPSMELFERPELSCFGALGALSLVVFLLLEFLEFFFFVVGSGELCSAFA